jgi:branched-subunit amino acid aminotransferase/4-amino-4-deoxychorismate lyase
MTIQNPKLKEIVFFNGKFIPQDEARASVFETGFLYGWGLFETMRSYQGGIVYLNEHLKRMQASSKLIKIKFPYPLAKIREAVKKTIKINSLQDAYIRINLWKSGHGSEISIIAKKYESYPSQKYKKGFYCQISQFRNNEGTFLIKIKSNNYLIYQLAYLEAKNKGFDEAILLNNRGFVAEASRSNIFLVKEARLFTPSLECGCLDGITRKVVFDLAKKYNLKIDEGNFTLQDLYNSDEIFLTNSLIGIMPAAAIEEYWARNKSSKDKLTPFLMKEYDRLLRRGE